jgi:murein DD-endopeptidase MepM/ murein hydrolase activator NlpD
MLRLRLFSVILLVLACTLAGGASAAPMGSSDVAALQVALHGRQLYGGTIDGLLGPVTAGAVRRLQLAHGLPASGLVDPPTRAALGPDAQDELGSRLLRPGLKGWDVAALQFQLAWHGFPSGPFDGKLGDRTEAALLKFQEWAGVPTTGQAGPLTLGALRAPPPRSPISLSWPLQLPVGDGFGPRGAAFHAGIDILAPEGARVSAAGAGTVVYAGWRDGGFGNEVTIDHGSGVVSMYMHLSRVDLQVGQQVSTGDDVGLVGSTGHAIGPHLHFEIRVRDAAVDPLTALA